MANDSPIGPGTRASMELSELQAQTDEEEVFLREAIRDCEAELEELWGRLALARQKQRPKRRTIRQLLKGV